MTVRNIRSGKKRPRDSPASEKTCESSNRNFVRCAIFATFCNPHKNTLDTINRNIDKKYSVLINLEDSIGAAKKAAIDFYQKLYCSKHDSKEVHFSSLFASDGSELADDVIFGSFFKEEVQLFLLLTYASDTSDLLDSNNSTSKAAHNYSTDCDVSCRGYIKTLLKTLDGIFEHHCQTDVPNFKRRKLDSTEPEKLNISEVSNLSYKSPEIEVTVISDPKIVSQSSPLQISQADASILINQQAEVISPPLSNHNFKEPEDLKDFNKPLDHVSPFPNAILDIPHDDYADTVQINQKSPQSSDLNPELNNKVEDINQEHDIESISSTDNEDSEYILAENTPLNLSPLKPIKVKSISRNPPKSIDKSLRSPISQKTSHGLEHDESNRSSATESLFSDIDTDDESHLIPRSRPVISDISPRQITPGKKKHQSSIPTYCVFSEDDNLDIKFETRSLPYHETVTPSKLNEDAIYASKSNLAFKDYNNDDSVDSLASSVSKIKKENVTGHFQDAPLSHQNFDSLAKKKTGFRETKDQPVAVNKTIYTQNFDTKNQITTKVEHDISSKKSFSDESDSEAELSSDNEPALNDVLNIKKEHMSPQSLTILNTVTSPLSLHISKNEPSGENLKSNNHALATNYVSSSMSVSNDDDNSSDDSSEGSYSEVEVSNGDSPGPKVYQLKVEGAPSLVSEPVQSTLNPTSAAYTILANSIIDNKPFINTIIPKDENTINTRVSSEAVVSNDNKSSMNESSEEESGSDTEASSESDSLDFNDQQAKSTSISTLKKETAQSTLSNNNPIQKSHITSSLADVGNEENSSDDNSEEGSDNDTKNDAESDTEAESESDAESDLEALQVNEQASIPNRKAVQVSSNPTSLLLKDQNTPPIDASSEEEDSSDESSEEESESESDSESEAGSPQIATEQVCTLGDKSTNNSAFLKSATYIEKKPEYDGIKSENKVPESSLKNPQGAKTISAQTQNSSETEDTSDESGEDESDVSSDETTTEKDTAATVLSSSLQINPNAKQLSIPHSNTNGKPSEPKLITLENKDSSNSAESSDSSEESEDNSGEDSDTLTKSNQLSLNITGSKKSKFTLITPRTPLSQLDIPLEQPISTGVMTPDYFKSLKRLPSLEGRYAATQNKRQRTASLASYSLSHSAVASPNLLNMNPPSESSGSEEDSDTSSEDEAENVTTKPSTQPSLISNNIKNFKPAPSPASNPNNIANRSSFNKVKPKVKKSSLLDLLHE